MFFQCFRMDPGQPISFRDVDVPDSLALQAWKQISAAAAGASVARSRTGS